MARAMMQLGLLQFSVDAAAYQRLTRSTEYRWSRQPRIGQNDALQFTGLGTDAIEVSGVIFPQYRGGTGQLDKMRLSGALGFPMLLVSGAGKVLGLWVVESVSEEQTIFAPGGVPRRQDFNMRLGRYDGGIRSLLRF